MKKKIKVLQVIPKLGYGGAETGCYDLAHFLPEQGCKSFIVTSGGELIKFIDKKKVKLYRLPVHSKNPLLILINAILIAFIILIKNINIVHARSRAPVFHRMARPCSSTSRKPDRPSPSPVIGNRGAVDQSTIALHCHQT